MYVLQGAPGQRGLTGRAGEPGSSGMPGASVCIINLFSLINPLPFCDLLFRIFIIIIIKKKD